MERDDWNRRYLADKLHPAVEPNSFLVEQVSDLEPRRALDLGSGTGRNAVWLAEQGWDVTAVDFSDVAVARARRLAALREVTVRWVRADLRDYRPPAEAFDLVTMLCVHLPRAERRLVLQRASTALAPAGTLLVVGHDLRNLGSGCRGPSSPDVLYTPEDLVADLPGLSIERADRVCRPIEADGDAPAIDTVLRASLVAGPTSRPQDAC